ncbi:hypothetical protein [Bacillus sp. T33-2]|uniref:hypothetical protein n=1 Tax=Bacillus sp. T33-2 TaxID=2054168 RepID=UPI000C792987|nr:hypothetical protein [Bacillus sp. T33-2]PLR95094.1 hypothetical protein CVD19_15675 [Bacillus sp. T33-2]
MKQIFCCLAVCMFLLTSFSLASGESTVILKEAYVKNDTLWMKIGESEKRISKGDSAGYPKWSFDVSWVAYL